MKVLQSLVLTAFALLQVGLALPTHQRRVEARAPGHDAEADQALDTYLANVQGMRYAALLGSLNDLLLGQTGVERLDQEIETLNNQAREFEDLKQSLEHLLPLLEDDHVDDMFNQDNGDDEFLNKRALEAIDKEDDWLFDDDNDDALFEVEAPEVQVLTSRRRLYPDSSPSPHDFQRRLSKKDLESLIYQADPSLTVHALPKDPQISFRKSDTEAAEASTTTAAAPDTTADPVDDKNKNKEAGKKEAHLQGMKEVMLMRPAIGKWSPLDAELEKKELNDLIKIKRGNHN